MIITHARAFGVFTSSIARAVHSLLTAHGEKKMAASILRKAGGAGVLFQRALAQSGAPCVAAVGAQQVRFTSDRVGGHSRETGVVVYVNPWEPRKRANNLVHCNFVWKTNTLTKERKYLLFVNERNGLFGFSKWGTSGAGPDWGWKPWKPPRFPKESAYKKIPRIVRLATSALCDRR